MTDCIAIHKSPGSFSDRWIEYCEIHSIDYRIVNCLDSDILEQLDGCSALLWHWSQSEYGAMLFAHSLIASLEIVGLSVFPNAACAWHYDDKIAQKYLLEAVGAPVVPTRVFYSKKSALAWSKIAQLPVVFKLRGGAGSSNVRLIRNRGELRRAIGRSFGSGWSSYPRFYRLSERIRQFREKPSVRRFVGIGRGLARAAYPSYNMTLNREKGYAYFQEFIPGNDHDIRVIVIGHRAFAIKRLVRRGDFRASGSGHVVYDPEEIPMECVKLSFEYAGKIGGDCVAFDFVHLEGRPMIVEVSYSFIKEVYRPCPGYWLEDGSWVRGHFFAEDMMIERVLERLDQSAMPAEPNLKSGTPL